MEISRNVIKEMKGRTKKFSVIIPCYNVSAYIDRCMTSVIRQTVGMDDIEIICIDDASTDATWICLQQWEKQYSENVMLIQLESNRKQGTARNIGMCYASGEWIAFVDADDWLEPDYLEQLYGPAIKYECDIVSCEILQDVSDTLTCFDEVARTGEMKEQYIVMDTGKTRNLLFKDHLLDGGVPGKLIRKSFLIEFDISFFEDLVYEDVYWSALVRFYARKIYIIGKRLYHYFYNHMSTVVAQNMDSHIDYITVQLRRWEDYKRRGLFKKYRDAVEYEALGSAVWFMWNYMWKYEEPPFCLFKLESEIIKQQVQEHRRHKYIADFEFTERVLLDLLYLSPDKQGFLQIIDGIKRLYTEQGKEKKKVPERKV